MNFLYLWRLLHRIAHYNFKSKDFMALERKIIFNSDKDRIQEQQRKLPVYKDGQKRHRSTWKNASICKHIL